MSAEAAKTGVDDYLAAGGTVAELLLMARPFDAADIATQRLSRDEQHRANIETLWTIWRAMPAVKRGDCTDRSVARELVRRAERGGKPAEGGIRVVASLRSLALATGVSTQGARNALARLEQGGFLRPDNDGRARDKAAAYVLLTGGALSRQDGTEQGHRGETGGKREATAQLRDDAPDRGVNLARASGQGVKNAARPADTGVPEMRWPTVLRRRELDKRGRAVVVYEYLSRLGKKRQAILEYLAERGGVCTVEELMERFAGPRARPRDFKRRTLAMLTELPAVIVVEGDVVSLGGRWREALEHAREIAGEGEAFRLQEQKYARQREAFRRRDEHQAEPEPEMRSVDDMRQPWPLHPNGCACRECVRRFGEPEGEHPTGCCCKACFSVAKEEASRAGRRVVPLSTRRRGSSLPNADQAPAPVVELRAPKPEGEPSRRREPLTPVDPGDDWRSHPLDCECQRCSAPPSRYATPWSASRGAAPRWATPGG